jgi:hypothetical protein
LAANNGDSLGEAVISVIRNEFRTGQQRKFQLKTTTENCTNIIINYLFQRCFKRCKPETVFKDQQVMIFMIKSSILLAWPLLPAGVHSLDRVAI